MPSGVPLVIKPPPAALSKGEKILWWITSTVAAGITGDQFTFNDEISALAENTGDPPATEWRRVVVRYFDTQSLDLADAQQYSLDIVNYTNGKIDNSWTTADHDAVKTAVEAFARSWLPIIPPRLSLDQMLMYRMAFRPYSDAKPFADTGSPAAAYGFNSPGSGTGTVPPQPCTTVTERTASRSNWGRLYSPTLAGSCYTAAGRLLGTLVDSIPQAYNSMFDALITGGFHLVVPTTSVNRSAFRALQSVSAVSVDDVTDAHHRRRFKHSTDRTILPTPTELGQASDLAGR